MGAGKVSTSLLYEFVAKCDELGGIESPNCVDFIKDFSLVFESEVDQTLDPFSETYVKQQIALYEEISARSLDQKIGELTPFGLEERINTANPYGTLDINFIAKHARCVQSALLAAKLPTAAKILDMGSGWGLSSEVIAFCGADVTSVDINPDFVTLVKRRSERLGLSITSIQSNFDEFTTSDKFDMIFFYECLHHAVRPWEVLKRVEVFLKAGGKVVFAGEPINDMWKHWGIRTDPLSVYCIRKFGWFESGWSLAFLNSAFAYAGLSLTARHGVGLGGGIIGVAVRNGEEVSNNLATLSPHAVTEGLQLLSSKFPEKETGLLRSFIATLFPRLFSGEKLTALTPSIKHLVTQSPESVFWHYQCGFDAQSTMSRYAASNLEPTEGYLTNFLGVKIDPKFFPEILAGRGNTIEPMPQPANWHADIAEFAAALRAVDLAGPSSTVLELGCGWGCWLNNTGAAARRAGKSVKLLRVEGDLGHVEFAKSSLVTNGYKPKQYEILHGVAAAKSGKALFPKQSVPGLAWGLEPVFGAKQDQIDKALRDGTHDCLEMIGLGEIVHKHGKLDLLHIDIQGGEADFVSESIELCNSFVRYIVIGTHSRVIEGTLEKLLLAHGWILEVDRPAIVQLRDSKQVLLVDGVQGWKNRRKIGPCSYVE